MHDKIHQFLLDVTKFKAGGKGVLPSSARDQKGGGINKGMTMTATTTTSNFVKMVTMIAAIEGGKPRRRMPDEGALHRWEVTKARDWRQWESHTATTSQLPKERQKRKRCGKMQLAGAVGSAVHTMLLLALELKLEAGVSSLLSSSTGHLA